MRLLSLDVGQRRIGVAIADPTGTIATPLMTIVRETREQDFAAIAEVVTKHEVGQVVVGLPLSLDGSESGQARTTKRVADVLQRRLSVPVVLWDERFTTVEAEAILLRTRSAGARRKARDRGEVDAIAAAVILQSYLDSAAEQGRGEQGGET